MKVVHNNMNIPIVAKSTSYFIFLRTEIKNASLQNGSLNLTVTKLLYVTGIQIKISTMLTPAAGRS